MCYQNNLARRLLRGEDKIAVNEVGDSHEMLLELRSQVASDVLETDQDLMEKFRYQVIRRCKIILVPFCRPFHVFLPRCLLLVRSNSNL
jgi:hypothetical protein